MQNSSDNNAAGIQQTAEQLGEIRVIAALTGHYPQELQEARALISRAHQILVKRVRAITGTRSAAASD